MENNQVNLGKLDYEQIKQSLTDFLKNQDTLKDYNFNGSVIQSLISLLAYNTFYYAFYSNMLANEMFLDTAQREESLVSILKPLGVLVPTKTSARVKINIGGTPVVNKYDQFYGKTDEGIVYSFYALEQYETATPGTDYIENVVLVEGKELVKNKDITPIFNYQNQTYFLGDRDIDVSTILVEVDTGDGVFKRWNLLDNIGDSTETLSQNIYFLERFDNGFELQFGKEKSLGNEIIDTYKIRISYLVSSGSAANGIVAFTKADNNGNITIELPNGTATEGGLDSPDLDYYKFIGPKYFASQNRAVTKDDFMAISTQYLRNKGYNITKNNFNIYGGDEIYPPKYGRVFVATDAIQTPDILDLVAYLKTKCTVTVLPEYVVSNTETVYYDVRVGFQNNNLSLYEKKNILTNIKNYLTENYSYISSYNVDFSGVEQVVLQKYSELKSCNIKLKFNRIYSNIPEGGLTINLENELDIGEGEEVTLFGPFNYNSLTMLLKANPNTAEDRTKLIKLKTYILNSSGLYVYNPSFTYGYVNIKEGYLKLDVTNENAVPFSVEFKYPDFVSGQNTRFSLVPNTVTEL